MSWSIQKTVGKPDKVKAQIAPQFDSASRSYSGKTEQKDVESARIAVNSWLDECNCGASEGVTVEASGSRGEGWVNVTVLCGKLALVI